MELLTNRFDLIDEFLLKLSTYALSKNDIEITPRMIYSNLIKININDDHDVTPCFSLWIEQFKYKKDINVYSNQYSTFCHFDNNKEEIIDLNCFKIFIPQDEKHIFKSVNKIFTFLQENNITHVSKVANNIRNDNIVIRLNSIEDTNKLNKFIKNDKYIQEGLLTPNPFTFQYSNIAYALDRRLSYNYEVSFLISLYLKYLKKENKLSTASLTSFKNFSVKYFNDTFKHGITFEEFIEERNITEKSMNREGLKFSKLDQLVNYKDIMSLIVKTLDTGNDFMKYMNHFEVINTKEYNYEASESINDLLFNIYQSEDKLEPFITIKEKERILQESLITTIKKYNMKQGKIALRKFILEGKVSGFTIDYNTRENILNVVTPTEARNIIKNFFSDELNIDEYVEITMNINLNKIKKELLDRAIVETIKEKGLLHTEKTIEKLIKNQNIEDLKKISKNNEARRNLYKFIELEEIEHLIKQTLLQDRLPGSLVQEKYINLYIQRINKNLKGDGENNGIIEYS